MNKLSRCALLCLAFPLSAMALAETPESWYAEGEAAIAKALALKPNQAKAKNIILFVGDGMGISTITATRIYDGQSRGGKGEENTLAWDKLPYTALSKTYNTNLQTPDSAGTMSAMMTGIKTGHGLISVNQKVALGHCASSRGNQTETFLEQAEQRDMATGIVTTARITHATPAATYAHAADRDWENDADLTHEARENGCKDIAQQLVEFSVGDGIEVVLGGGRRNFLPTSAQDPEHAESKGKRTDGRNLIDEWQAKTKGEFVWNGEQLSALEKTKSQANLLGLFSPSHMAYDLDRAQEQYSEPSLADMTRVAINRLKSHKNGFFLMVEGGRIDHAHHASNAARALGDGKALSDAVAQALALVDLQDTLVIVTADHSHVFTMGGYPARGNPILGLVHSPDQKGVRTTEPTLAADGKPYTTLGYINGPGYAEQASLAAREVAKPNPGRHLHQKVDTQQKGFFQESLVPLSSETHGGEDVAIFAGGPWAHLFHGTHEQHYIYHVMRYAAGFDSPASKK
ncbi:alkaline phosphatase [Simiduia curdlanivorans]|uniref:Alkaline phosphatase n=1 Tax=Simiduia curdlanivorans TaxID=1492769 RepID=A0ABV8V835_9GAMM|nr:alkaline phosphatase [Simiduia curdlanivorans]MDN3639010.1 alkaline phosphatase [Simiduia curdlanivorans]